VSDVTPIGVDLQADDFELFSVVRQFAQELPALEARWKALQREAHPDKFAAQGPAAQRIAMQWSVRINEAYQRLKDPVKRAAYLCELGGVPVLANTNTAMPTQFLMQQMEWRETLEDATSETALDVLAGEVKASRQQVLQQCAQALDVQHDLPRAVELVRSLMFTDKFLQDLDRRRDQLE
jgi:molecular chaperone HscB